MYAVYIALWSLVLILAFVGHGYWLSKYLLAESKKTVTPDFGLLFAWGASLTIVFGLILIMINAVSLYQRFPEFA